MPRTVIFPFKLIHWFHPSGQVTLGTFPLSHLPAPIPGTLVHTGHSIPDTGNEKLNWIPVWWRFTLLSVRIFFRFSIKASHMSGKSQTIGDFTFCRPSEVLLIYREYFMESAGVRYLHTSCFFYQKSKEWTQRTSKYRTKHFTCGIVFIVYIRRHSSFWWPFYFESFQNA